MSRGGEILHSVYDAEEDSLRVTGLGSTETPATQEKIFAGYLKEGGKFGRLLIQNGSELRSARIEKIRN